jgi:hypothetical protein
MLAKQFSETDTPPINNADKVIDFAFKMDGIRLLRRDDNDSIDSEIAPDSQFDEELHYDIVLLKLEVVEVAFSLTSDGDTSLTVTLSRISLHDLGDLGRLARDHFSLNIARLNVQSGTATSRNSTVRNPSAFSVIVRGIHQPRMMDWRLLHEVTVNKIHN